MWFFTIWLNFLVSIQLVFTLTFRFIFRFAVRLNQFFWQFLTFWYHWWSASINLAFHFATYWFHDVECGAFLKSSSTANFFLQTHLFLHNKNTSFILFVVLFVVVLLLFDFLIPFILDFFVQFLYKPLLLSSNHESVWLSHYLWKVLGFIFWIFMKLGMYVMEFINHT